MNIRLTLVTREGGTEFQDLNTRAAADVSMETLQSMTLPFTRDDIRGIEFDGSELTLTLDSGELVVSDFIDEFGEIKEIYTVNGQLLFKDASDLISQLSAPAAGNVAADGTTSVFSFLNEDTPFLDGNGLGYRDLRGDLGDPEASSPDLNGDPDNPLAGDPEADQDPVIDDTPAVNSAPIANDDQADTVEDTVFNSLIELDANDTDADGDPLTVVEGTFTTSQGGSITILSDGSYSYTPPENFNGADSIDYTVTDGELTDTGTLTLNVQAVNDAPVAVDDSAQTEQDTVLLSTIDLDANDFDVDGDTLTVVSGVFDTSQGGEITINSDGSYVYTPPADFSGIDSVSYTVSDGELTDDGTLTINVVSGGEPEPTNNAPVAVDDFAKTPEGTVLNSVLDLDDNDFDPDGDSLTVIAGDFATDRGGNISISADGSYIYTPAPGYSGFDTVTYTVTDGELSDTGVLYINVEADEVPPPPPPPPPEPEENTAPVAQDDFAETAEDSVLVSTVDLDANDTDADGDALSVVAGTFATSAGGSITINGDGSYTYTPPADFNGTDTVDYTVTDGQLSDTGTLSIAVGAVNDPPVAVDDQAETPEDVVLNSSIDLDANDFDVDGDSLTVQEGTFATAEGGSIIISTDGSYSYTPPADFNGTDTVDYTVTDGQLSDTGTLSIAVGAVNDPPVAVDDQAETPEDVVLNSSIDLDANDFDVDGDSLTVLAGTFPTTAGGSISINTDGSYTYTPPTDFNGDDSVDYTVTDGLLTDIGTLTISVTAVNDAPVAVDDNAQTNQDTVLNSTVDLDDNDFDVDGDSLTVTAGTFATSEGGSISISADGSYSYTPANGFSGVDTVEYTVSDGLLSDTGLLTVVVIAGEENSPPVAVDDSAETPEDTVLISAVDLDANDIDVDGDALTVTAGTFATAQGGSITIDASGSYVYTPKENFYGTDTVDYTVSDGEFSDTGTLTITVTPVNDPPVAVDDEVTIDEGTVFNSTIDLDANDTDVDGDPLSVVAGIFETDKGGEITIYSDGSYTYRPLQNFNGTDTVSYTVSDGQLTDTGTLTIIVNAVNDAPVAYDDTANATEDIIFNSVVDLDTNDIDPDGDPLTVVAGTFATTQGGVIQISADGSYIYTPKNNFNGTDTVDYTVTDGQLSDVGTLTIEVAPVQDPPVAVDDSGAVNEDATLTVSAQEGVLSNDIEVDGEGLTVIGIRTGEETGSGDPGSVGTELVGVYGTLTLYADGSYTYVADQDRADLLADGVSDTDTFTYTVADDFGDTDTAELVITVTGVADGGCPVLHPGNDGEVFIFSGNAKANPIVGTDGFDILIVNDTSLNISEKPNTFFDLERIHLCGRNNNFTNQELQNISAKDIFDITDADNILLVTGDGPTGEKGAVNAGDSVDLDPAIWTLDTAVGTELIDGMTFETYIATYNDGSSDHTVTLKVETELNVI